MIKYSPKLKEKARRLRAQMTDSERKLWARLRREQVESVQCYTQRPIGNYIVDFYAPKAKLVVEVDGSQHMESQHVAMDSRRDAHLASEGLRVLRFDNLQVLKEIEGSDGSYTPGGGGIPKGKSPRSPLFQRGERIVALLLSTTIKSSVTYY